MKKEEAKRKKEEAQSAKPTGGVAPFLCVTPTRDVAYINSIIRHPAIYDAARDDTTPPPEKLTAAPLVNKAGYFFLRIVATPSKTDLGMFMLEPMGRGHVVHTFLLPTCRGARAVAAGKLGAAWIFTHTNTAVCVSHCWETRPEVLWFAKHVGFEPRTLVLWPARVHGAQIFSTGVCLTRDRWLSLQCNTTSQKPKTKTEK